MRAKEALRWDQFTDLEPKLIDVTLITVPFRVASLPDYFELRTVWLDNEYFFLVDDKSPKRQLKFSARGGKNTL